MTDRTANDSKPATRSAGSSSSAPTSDPSRRKFLSGTLLQGTGAVVAGSLAAGTLPVARAANAYGSDTIKIGLIGCGGRGTQAAIQALNTTGGGVKLVAMADIFENSLQTAYRGIKGAHKDKIDVEDTRFLGLEAYKDVLSTDCDFVILATPPGFRPQQFEAAVEAGKHVFMEKPVATDAPGVRRVLAANKIAKEKGLAVQVGLQRRHEFRYKEVIDRVQNGAIGDLMLARVYWNNDGVWVKPRSAGQTELEHQLSNWYYFNWLCGDHITEQHIHNLDVINWVTGEYPIEAQGQGGREVRDGLEHGQIFDHHMVEYTYPSGLKMLSQCRHIRGCWSNVSEHLHGTKGVCDLSGATVRDAAGKVTFQSDAEEAKGKGWQQEHYDFFDALRKGETPNEGDYGALSTMTSIMGRMATYSGKIVKWDEALASDIALADTDALTSFSDEAPVQPDPDGYYPVPVPGSKVKYV